MNNQIFALDIGTQSVTGIILKRNEHTYTVIDYCMKEHNERAMLDGQIHDVVKVANIIKQVKETLERKHGSLNSVSVAAAGRALKTVQAKASISLHQQPITNTETIKHLELSAVQKAQNKLIEQENNQHAHYYYCVGFSVLHYKLDDQKIGSLIDQSGDQASVEIIATFLPKVVVESLLASLQRADLKMEALTLEPIAAIHVLIPESMRRLNVALVDIGAGTSDIAITNQGTVVAYGMVPIAGDEITEALSDHYLLDFPKAEQAKREIVNHRETVIQDILGFETIIKYEDVVQAVSKNIEKLSNHLAEEIFKLNKKAPQAVMLIGGGSLTPKITSFLAQKLQLPENRVAVRDIDAIRDIENVHLLPQGPDFITPIGIAISSQQNPVHYMSVTVNEQTIRLFEMKQLTVGDCLIQAGIEINKQYGKPGLAYMIKVNDKNMTLPGQFGEPPSIFLNGKKVTVECPVKDGDKLMIEKGIDGRESCVTIKELFDEIVPLTILIGKEQRVFKPIFHVNEKRKDENYILQDKDDLIIDQPKTIQDIVARLNEQKNVSNDPFPVIVNGKVIYSKVGQTEYVLNGKKVLISHPVKQNDQVKITYSKTPTLTDVLNQLEYPIWNKIAVTFNDENVILKRNAITVTRNGEKIDELTPLNPNDKLKVLENKDQPFIFQDVFRFVEFNLSDVKGHYKLYKNDEETTFHEIINDGDHLSIR